MPQRQQIIAPGITFFATQSACNSIVVAGLSPDSGTTMVVDPSWTTAELSTIRAAAEASPAGRATHILFTHGDPDHVGAWDEFGQTTLIAHPAAARRDPAAQEAEAAMLDREFGFARPRPYHYPSPDRFTSPESLDLGGETALFFPAPGHVHDCLFTVLPERQVFLAGDYIEHGEGPYVIDSLRRYRETLLLARELCSRFRIQKLLPGHYRAAESPEEIEYRIATDLEYLDRLNEGVISALSDGLSPDEAVERLKDIPWRGAPITEVWSAAHDRNVRIACAKPGELVQR